MFYGLARMEPDPGVGRRAQSNASIVFSRAHIIRELYSRNCLPSAQSVEQFVNGRRTHKAPLA